jgi:hypothetical protein
VLVLVPPEILNPVANEVGVTPLMVLLVKVSVPDKVANVPVVGNVTFVTPVLANVVLKLPAVVKSEAVVNAPPNVTAFPPIFETNGAAAVPAKSPVN